MFRRLFLFPSNTAGSHAATTRPCFRLIPKPRYTLPPPPSILLSYRRIRVWPTVAHGCPRRVNSFCYVFRCRQRRSPVSDRVQMKRAFFVDATFRNGSYNVRTTRTNAHVDGYSSGIGREDQSSRSSKMTTKQKKRTSR